MGLILFILSTLGYIVALTSFLKINWRSTILLSFALNSLLIYFFALIGYLQLGMCLTFFLGIILFLVYIRNFHKNEYKFNHIYTHIKVFDLLLLFFLGAYIVTMPNEYFTHYDNYSHWAVIIKHLYTFKSLPNLISGTGIVTFLSYPPITAIFSNYFLQFSGYGPTQMMIAYLIIIYSSYASLTTIIKKSSAKLEVLQFVILFLSISILQFLTYSVGVRLNDLVVDYLISIVALSLFCNILIYKKFPLILLVNLSLIGSFLSLIKNSALLFLFFAFLLTIYQYNKSIQRKKNKICTIILSLFCFVPFALWNSYTSNLISEKASKHTMSFSHYQEVLSSKSDSSINIIVRLFLKNLLNLKTSNFRNLLIIFVVFFLVMLFAYIAFKRKKIMKVYFSGLVIAIVYYIGTLLMYIFSMPENEALYLASFDRYAMTINVFILGIYMWSLLYLFFNYQYRNFDILDNLKSIAIISFSCLMLVFINFIFFLSNLNIYPKPNNYDYASNFYKVVGDHLIFNDKRYLIIDEKTRNEKSVTPDYARYVGRYFLYSNNVDIYKYDSKNFNDLVLKYNYVIIDESEKEIIELLDNFKIVENKNGMRIYKI